MNTITRCFDLLENGLSKGNKADHFAAKVNGSWVEYNTEKVIELSTRLALGLLALGVEKDDKIAIISNNRPEWCITDYAIQQAGAISVPIYSTISEEDTTYIFNDCDVNFAFVSTPELFEKVKRTADTLKKEIHIFIYNSDQNYPNWAELITIGITHKPYALLEERRNAVLPTNVLTIIYTSGTTGNPKGVMLTHHNILSNIEGAKPAMPVKDGDRALSFLPLCHVYERMLCYLYQRFGVGVWFAESMDTIIQDLKDVKPHIFTTVPRLLEKVYDGIVNKGNALKGISKLIFFWALNLGLRFDVQGRNSVFYKLQLWIARQLVFVKWQEALGGNIVAIVSGSAALQPRLSRVFRAAGIDVMEGYGLTETSPVISVNRKEPDGVRVGTVGPLIDGVEVKIAEDGEILVKGPNIMLGYFNKPELTAEAFTPDGYFKTGDIGEMVEGRFLKITDRKKEIFKTSGGKYIIPQKTENLLKESTLIEQAMVIGEGQKFPAALIIPNLPALKDWLKAKNLTFSSLPAAIALPVVQEKYQKEVDKANETLGQYEKIKKFLVLAEPWGVDSGELTPTLKLKRKAILGKYAKDVNSIYENQIE